MNISRVFYSFLILIFAAMLWLVPVTEGVYAFRTDLREDGFTVATAIGTDNTTVQLTQSIYDDDTSTLCYSSDDTDDAPYYSSYNATSRALVVAGLSDNTTRTLTIGYDVEAFAQDSLDTLLDIIPWVWVLMIVGFPVAACAALWTGRI